MINEIFVRFAPSPTGHLHIGGVRTALFNYLFARQHRGCFTLRIEDTDRERSTPEYLDSILKGMEWLGLEWDGKPIKQSERSDLYKEYLLRLLITGKAYQCYCTPEELQAKREAAEKEGRKPKYDGTCRERTDKPDLPYCVRFKAPQTGVVSFDDLCRGTITVDAKELDDLVIARVDGTPTYNFTVVVDDFEMRITHVIRGDDHINNTPRQIQLYEAIGLPVPRFAHLPMILGPDKKKLSKRHGAVSVVEYQEKGFLPEAMLNYLARLGWSCGDQEIFTKQELIEKFSLKSIGSSPSIFDIEKCAWVNNQHMLRLSDEALVAATRPHLEALGLQVTDIVYAARALNSEKEKARTLKELAEVTHYFFRDTLVAYDEEAKAKWLNEEGRANLALLQKRLAKISKWTEEKIQDAFDTTLKKNKLQFKQLGIPARIALTGSTKSPGITEVIAILGKERVLKRLAVEV